MARVRGPFAALLPWLLVAGAWAVGVLVSVLSGEHLPGGRWLAVHLATLGVLTTLVLAFSDHFARTLTRAAAEDRPPRWPLPILTVGVGMTVAGRGTDQLAWFAAGATAVSLVVLASWWRLRGLRRRAIGARLTWVVRLYERAHGAFVHGALLGVLVGTAALPPAALLPTRIAHLHVMVLGWAGLTMLATITFLGPTIVRTRIEAGADDRAARWLRRGASGLTAGVLLLIASSIGGAAGTVLRVAAAGGLAVYGVGVTVVCVPVVTAALRAASPDRPWLLVAAIGCWFPVAVWADVLVVATARWWLLDALGLVVLVGVLGQAVVATLAHVIASMSPGTTPSVGDRALVRAVLLNLGVALVVLAAVDRTAVMATAAQVGLVLVVLAIAQVVLGALGPRRA